MGGTFVEVGAATGCTAVAAIVGRVVAAGGTGLAVGVIGAAHAANTIKMAGNIRANELRLYIPPVSMEDAITMTAYRYTKEVDAR